MSEVFTKICGICGNSFATSNNCRLYCCDKCKRKANDLSKNRYEEYEKICPTCGKKFITHRERQRFCSKSCAKRVRKTEAGGFDNTLEWKRSPTDESKWQCPYRRNVECDVRDCYNCGRHPDVAKMRLEAYMRRNRDG